MAKQKCALQAYYCKSQTGLEEIMEFYPYSVTFVGERMTSEQIKGIALSLGQNRTRQLCRLQLLGLDFAKWTNLQFQCRTDKSLSEAFLGKMIIPKVRTASSSYCLLATCAEDPAIRPTSFLPRLSFLGPTRVYCSLRYAIPLTVLTSRSKMYFGFMTGP